MDSSSKPTRWEGTHLYSRATPGRRPRTASLIRDEAAAKTRQDREKRKQEEEEKRRSLSVGSLSTTDMSGAKAKKGPVKGTSVPSAIPAPNTRQRQSIGMADSQASADPITDPAAPQGATNVEEDVEIVSVKGNQAAGQEGGHGIDPAQAAFFYAMESRLKNASQKSVDDISGLFKRNIERIDNNAKAITDLKLADQSLEKKIVDTLGEAEARAIGREKDMEERITLALTRKLDEAVNKTTISARAAVASAAMQPVSGAVLSRREIAYNQCRRSLKVWPVVGDDLEDSFRVFLREKLGLSDLTIAAIGPLKVTKRPGLAAERKSEVLATFESKEDRDLVKAAGPNLAGQADVGLMIHVPGHLLDNLHALNNVGYHIKQKNSGVRRTVKFDDENQDIYMDIKIGEHWKRITPAEAKQVARSMPQNAASSSRNLSVEDLSALVQGEEVEGLNAVVIPDDST